MCCFLDDVWEDVGKSNVSMTGCVSSCHSLLNGELFGGVCRARLVSKATTRRVMNLLINQKENSFAIAGFQPTEDSCYIFIMEYGKIIKI